MGGQQRDDGEGWRIICPDHELLQGLVMVEQRCRVCPVGPVDSTLFPCAPREQGYSVLRQGTTRRSALYSLTYSR